MLVVMLMLMLMVRRHSESACRRLPVVPSLISETEERRHCRILGTLEGRQKLVTRAVAVTPCVCGNPRRITLLRRSN